MRADLRGGGDGGENTTGNALHQAASTISARVPCPVCAAPARVRHVPHRRQSGHPDVVGIHQDRHRRRAKAAIGWRSVAPADHAGSDILSRAFIGNSNPASFARSVGRSVGRPSHAQARVDRLGEPPLSPRSRRARWSSLGTVSTWRRGTGGTSNEPHGAPCRRPLGMCRPAHAVPDDVSVSHARGRTMTMVR